MHVVGVGEDGELGVREEANHFDGVFGANDVAIAAEDERGRLNGTDLIGHPALEVQHALDTFVEEALQILGLRGFGEIGFAEFERHLVEPGGFEGFPEGGGAAFAAEHGGFDDEAVDGFGMGEGDLYSDVAAIAVAKEVGFLDFEVVEESEGVVGRLLEGEGAIGDVGGASVALLVEGDDEP